MKGQVILVGAGPGARGLLTLRGAEALRTAEVVVYDRLVGADVLAMMPAEAEQINVGKRSSHHLVPQDGINEILIEKAHAGKRVVRLKGGDCYLFGRGGEECEALRAAGIPFEVVPGVTSALSAPAFAGIPVTHRDFCSSVHIVTAHAREGGQLHIDFESLARMGGTLVFLMGVSALGFVLDGLRAAGMPADTPAAVVENGTRFDQRRLVAELATLEGKAREMGLKSPAVIVVGRVCTLADELDWFSALPLHGKRIVVTRPRARAGTLADKLRALGAGVTEYPCIETAPVRELEPLRAALGFSYDWAVFTSPAGVGHTLTALKRLGRDFRALYGMKFAAIGPGTADALAACGVRADLMPETYDAAHLGAALAAAAGGDDSLLLLRALEASPALPAALDAAGLTYADVPVYETVYRNAQGEALADEIAAGEVAFVTFTSASTVRGFLGATPGADPTRFTAVCIGEQTAAEARAHGMRVKISKEATIDALIACILEEC